MAKLTPKQTEMVVAMYKQHPAPALFDTPGEKSAYAALFKKGMVHCVSGPEKWCPTGGGNAIEAMLTPEGAAAAAEATGDSSKRASISASHSGSKGKKDAKRSSSSRRMTKKATTKGIEFTIEHPSGKVDHYAYTGSRYEKNGKATAKGSLPKYIQEAFDEARTELPPSKSTTKRKSAAKKSTTKRKSAAKKSSSAQMDLFADAPAPKRKPSTKKATTKKATTKRKPSTKKATTKRKSSTKRKSAPRLPALRALPRDRYPGREAEKTRLLHAMFADNGRAFGQLTSDEAFILATALEYDNPRHRPEGELRGARLSPTLNETLIVEDFAPNQLRALRGLMSLGLVEIDRVNKRTTRGYSRPTPSTSVVRLSPEGRKFARTYVPSFDVDAGPALQDGAFSPRRGRPTLARRRSRR